MRGFSGLIRTAAVLLALPLCAAVSHADVKIKSKQTMSGHTSEQTTYIKGKRQRYESEGNQLVSIQQCDLRRDIQLNSMTKTYVVNPYDQGNDAAQAGAAADGAQGPVTRGGLVTTTITNKDTGERKQMFGYTARHIITTMVTESSPDSCTPTKSRMEVDGWYIDAAFSAVCDNARDPRNYLPTQKGGCKDRYNTKQIGAVRTGYPVWTKTTVFGEDGATTYTMLNEVVELSKATLDPALFDVPADYRQVKDSSEMYSAAAMSQSASAANEDEGGASGNQNSGLGAGVKSMGRQQPSAAQPVVGAKKEGVVRIGLAAVKTGAVGDGMNAQELGAAIQNTLSEYLKGPGVEVVQIDARLPAQIEAEAKQKECDYVVHANVSHKKGGGGGFGKMFGGSGAAVVGGAVSMGGYGSHGAAVASSVASTAIYTAASMSSNIKSKDEITLDVKLQAPDSSAPAVTRQFKAKARSNGEDIISPTVEQAAQAIMDAAARG